jgi:hypothetical protein
MPGMACVGWWSIGLVLLGCAATAPPPVMAPVSTEEVDCSKPDPKWDPQTAEKCRKWNNETPWGCEWCTTAPPVAPVAANHGEPVLVGSLCGMPDGHRAEPPPDPRAPICADAKPAIGAYGDDGVVLWICCDSAGALPTAQGAGARVE